MPWTFLVCISVWLIVAGLTRYVSLASIAAAIALPAAAWTTQSNRWLLTASFLLGMMAIYRHRSNIQRLYQGTEHRIGEKTNSTSQAN
jgi:glycerol-3-phosphate acyltransferase PlsY